jgi:signal peptidase I
MKKSYRIMRTVFAIVGVVAVIIVVSVILLINHNKNALIINGSAMSPTLNNGQRVTLESYASNQAPARGDVIEFTETGTTTENLVKRVVGVPGDRVTINNGKVTIINAQNPNGFNPDSSYLPSNTTTSGNIDVTLQSKQYFVLGDNRSDSLDSRVFGPVNASQIIGKIKL